MELSPFLSVYKRYSKYTTQVHTCRPKTPADFGQLIEMDIDRYGDFIKTIFVKMTLPPTFSDYIYTGSPGLHIFEYIELVIGDTIIDRVDGYYMSLYYETRFSSDMNSPTFNENFGGDISNMSEYIPPNGLAQIGQDRLKCYTTDRNRSIFFPIPFYFMNVPSLAVPLCLLKNQEIKLRFKLRPWQDMLIKNIEYAQNLTYLRNPADLNIQGGGPLHLVDLSVPVEFAYISDEDFKTISSKPSMHYITQKQLQVVPVGTSNSVKALLEFTNPVKCLYFFARYDNTKGMIYRNQYSERKNKARLDKGKAWAHHIQSIQLEFDNEVFLNSEIANYQFLSHIERVVHSATPFQSTILNIISTMNVVSDTKELYPNFSSKVLTGPSYMYSFALDPFSEIPTGTLNFSAVRYPYIQLNMFSADANGVYPNVTGQPIEPRSVYIYAESFNVLAFLPKEGVARFAFHNPILKK